MPQVIVVAIIIMIIIIIIICDYLVIKCDFDLYIYNCNVFSCVCVYSEFFRDGAKAGNHLLYHRRCCHRHSDVVVVVMAVVMVVVANSSICTRTRRLTKTLRTQHDCTPQAKYYRRRYLNLKSNDKK